MAGLRQWGAGLHGRRPTRRRPEVRAERREDLLNRVVALRGAESDTEGWVRLEVTFQDLRHAEWALWQLSTDAEALAPASLRGALRDRAATLAGRYAQS
ncbi:WYL domain-containing protein [Streptomyces sp. B1-3]|uniref:WYL domain-containing protein n=1 Tax=Streptomyces sp. B1-3 TaxID=3141453 RepID=UPI003D296733